MCTEVLYFLKILRDILGKLKVKTDVLFQQMSLLVREKVIRYKNP